MELDEPVGNTFDKYNTRNPLLRRLVNGFEASLDVLFAVAQPRSILDFGCGEGVLTERWAKLDSSRRIVGVDLEHPSLLDGWEHRRHANLAFLAHAGGRLPFGACEFDLVAAIEVLEHLGDPKATLHELRRVAQRWLLVSVPREPLWRALNVMRGAYLSELGNTPGHRNHWSKNDLVRLLSSVGRVEAVRSPFPWTQVLVDVR